jgi:coproporphyrinogen III oxidase-like Fe-S oxidoreductase
VPLFLKEIDQLIEKGWFQKTGNQITLTSQGVLFYDSVAVKLI